MTQAVTSPTQEPFPASLETAPHTIKEPASQRLKGRVREPGRAKQKGREIFITMTASFLVRIYEPIGEEGSIQSMNFKKNPKCKHHALSKLSLAENEG